ncbi:MAG: chromosome segregation protein SMC [Oxalobacteraceae bacterium]
MRLTSIKLSGFKSFVDPTNFQVPGQLVGVVGPNGCGKSNIIDAVRWVLGETKASELRGESMQDVIFNGTTSRKPAGRASVELLFDNSSGKAAGQWSSFAEISVKRILTRDGSSTYYINNQAVRRRDVQDIFLGTGLGPRAYAIIGQGMISRIIEARPEELRIFLEEAAGVSKYKERRRETENRLQDTRENLQRVEDILRELSANLAKLEAQAEVAAKYHTLHAEQEEKQRLLWLLRRNEARSEQEKFLRDIEKGQTDLEEQTAKLRHIETELEHMRQAHYASGDRMHQAQGALYQTNSEIGSLEAQIKFVIESRSRLQTQLSSLSAQRDQWQRQSTQFQDELSQAEAELEVHSGRVAEAGQLVEHKDAEMPALEEAWRAAQMASTESRSRIMQVQQRIELESANQRNASNILANLTQRRERLQQEKGGMSLPDTSQLSELRAHVEEKQEQLEHANSALEDARQRQPRLEQDRRDAQEQAIKENATHAQLEARLATLKQLQDNLQTEGKVAPWLEKHELGKLPRLWQKLNIEAGWETALESVLRERTGALEVSNLEWAKAFFSDAPPAKLSLFSLSGSAAGAGDAAAGLKPLLSLMQLNDPGLRALMQDWLHNVYVAEDAKTAMAERSRLPAGACFVTQQGHLIRKLSVRFYATDSEQDGMLARQQEIDNLVRQVKAQQLLADEARQRSVQADAALTQGTQKLEELTRQVASLTDSLHALQMDLLRQDEVIERISQRSTQIDTDLAEIAAQEAEQSQIRQKAEAALEQLDVELGEVQEKHEDGQTVFLEHEQKLNQAREALRELELAAQQAEFSKRSHENRIEELKRSITTALEQSAQLFASMEQGQLELESLDDQAAQAGLQSLLERRSEQEVALANARHELDQLTQRMRGQEEAKLAAERAQQPLRDRIVELQLKEQAARLNQEQFAQHLAEAEVDEAVLAEKLNDDMRPAYLQGEVTRLTNQITALGPVNMAALDELAQASERKNFLDAQHADLTEAITTLEDAIQKIDLETRGLLQDTFDKVNHHFGQLFPELFGGGNAKLVMTGEEILDSGVQVMAQPPGKKNATIHLLSGGEKALTATALVFSIFQLNPAPFCLLDEVDAPLDDSNTERFCTMVKRMTAQTQFLFITHNKIAMEMAQLLIGVTMQEQGVSRLVAVDMEAAAHLASEVQAA